MKMFCWLTQIGNLAEVTAVYLWYFITCSFNMQCGSGDNAVVKHFSSISATINQSINQIFIQTMRLIRTESTGTPNKPIWAYSGFVFPLCVCLLFFTVVSMSVFPVDSVLMGRIVWMKIWLIDWSIDDCKRWRLHAIWCKVAKISEFIFIDYVKNPTQNHKGFHLFSVQI